MAEPWSRLEVEATVSDYLAMLRDELSGIDYNKADHRRRLQAHLKNRSNGAIERKHQNISAILIELGFVYISGYKPLSNYQHLLMDVIEERLAQESSLRDLLRRQVEADATTPSVDEILQCLEAPPKAEQFGGRSGRPGIEDRPAIPRKFDYLEIEARNRSLGAAGEEFVVNFEIARLLHAGQTRLANRIEHVSQTKGDGLGFDLLSYEQDGRERLIEVKTTAYGSSTPFFITPNELKVSNQREANYHVYRPYNFRKDPKLFVIKGAVERQFLLEPSLYMARFAEKMDA